MSDDLDAAYRMTLDSGLSQADIDDVGIDRVVNLIHGNIDHANEIAQHHMWSMDLMRTKEVQHEAHKLKRTAQAEGKQTLVSRLEELCGV